MPVRQSDKPPIGNSRRDRAGGAGRRRAEKADKPQAPQLCGWNLPPVPDENDLLSWMKREKNGDNHRKKVNEVYEEEQYRHDQNYCTAIENRLLFDRQSLDERYLKHCQFGIKESSRNAANRCAPSVVLAKRGSTGGSVAPTLGSARDEASENHHSQTKSERNCFSASAMVGENGAVERDEEGEEMEVGVGEEEETRRVAVSRGRSRSAVCDSAAMRAHGMTLPDSRLHRTALYDRCVVPAAFSERETVPDGYDVKDEAEDGGWDEGYGSKVSSNDQDGVEPEEMDGEKTFRDGAGGDDGLVQTLSMTGTAIIDQPEPQQLSHQDAIAKLMYSRREKTVYERLPSRRGRGNNFRYAGREQSRLTEASLSNITPAYLARYHHLADLANQALTKQQQADIQSGGGQDQAFYGETDSLPNAEDGVNGLQPRTMVLRKITIQDSGRELYSQKPQQNGDQARSGVNSQVVNASLGPQTKGAGKPFDRVYRRQGVLSPTGLPHHERAVSETQAADSSRQNSNRTSRSEIAQTREPGSAADMSQYGTSVAADVTSHCGTPDTTVTVTTVTTLNADNCDNNIRVATPRVARLSVPGDGGVDAGHNPLSSRRSPVLSPGQHSAASGERLAMNTFPMTDLLPAVERNIRIQRSSQRGAFSRAKTNMDLNSYLHNGQRQQQRGQYDNRDQGRLAVGGVTAGGGGNAYGHTPRKGDVRGLPAFRPHLNTSPLQRVKEISNRRIHGLITQLPDGSEQVRVPSPRYASRTEQKNSNSRAKSASRLLGQIMSKQPAIGYRNGALM